MKRFMTDKRITCVLAGITVFLAALLVTTWFYIRSRSANRIQSTYEEMVRETKLTAAMQINLLASAEAEKSAVMADTDQKSNAFAAQSMRATAALEKARRELGQIIEDRKINAEANLFREFSSCWEKLRAIDQEILPLAVQNTNLKALRLSFFPAGEAIKRMETELNRLMDMSSGSPEEARITRLACIALLGAFNTYSLQAPHIAETTEANMDAIEKDMEKFDTQVKDALGRLQILADEKQNPMVESALATYAEFHKINIEIIDLSRRNSNIRSFALSLGRKRNLTVQCQEILAALQAAIQESITFKATR